MILKNKKWICLILAILLQLVYSRPLFARYLFDTRAVIEQRVDDILNLPKNTGRATERVTDAVGDLFDATGSKGVNQITDYQKSTAQREAALKMHRDNPKFKDGTQVKDVLNNKGKYSPEQYQAALNTYSGYVAEELGVDSTRVKIYSQKDGKAGMSDKDRTDAYVNAQNTNVTDTNQLIGVTSHELGHQRGENEVEAERSREHGNRAWDRENQYSGDASGQGYAESHNDWKKKYQKSPVLEAGNNMAGKVERYDPMYPLYLHLQDGGEYKGEKEVYYDNLKKNKNVPHSLSNVNSEVYDIYKNDKNLLHQWDNEKTIKIVSKDGHKEGIYNKKTGKLTSNPKNRGTYNQFHPDKLLHGEDVRLYIQYGTGADDSTTFVQRAKKSIKILQQTNEK